MNTNTETTATPAQTTGAESVDLQRLVRSPSRRADDDAWSFVRRMKEEWTYEDWEDFYEGIKGAMEKIAERHRAPNAGDERRGDENLNQSH